MWKVLLMLFVAGAAGPLAVDAAHACGGGGCGSMGGGGGYGQRAVASRKASGGGPNLAQAEPPSTRRSFNQATDVAVKAESAKFTVAAKVNATAKIAANPSIYSCPMHAQVQWTKPTDCPICGMKLKLKQTKSEAVRRGLPKAGDHAAMNMDEGAAESEAMGGMPGMGDGPMDGMNDMMMCPGCMMNMGGGKQAPASSSKASGGGTRGMAGGGCGC